MLGLFFIASELLCRPELLKNSRIVEADETFIGGKAKNMHKSKREKLIKGRDSVGKTAVMGILERKGKVHAKVIADLTRETLHGEINEWVEKSSEVFADEWRSYRGLSEEYFHEVVCHSIDEYVRGNVPTNRIENFWSLLKRSISGTYFSVEPFHLPKYVAEQTFRFIERKDNDKGKFLKVVSGVKGKRLINDELRGYTRQF